MIGVLWAVSVIVEIIGFFTQSRWLHWLSLPAWLCVCTGLMALRMGLTVGNAPGLIDSGYRGELKVILINLGDAPVAIAAGDRIAQLVLVPVALGAAAEVDELPESDGRGAGGFGSTGR
jgi:deoxyuridine 5'-triphosphate nucleotidohydrolase